MWGCFLMSGVKILHFLKDWWKSIPIYQNYTIGPFTLASKNRGFSKFANLRWKLLSNFLKQPKNLARKTLLRSGFF